MLTSVGAIEVMGAYESNPNLFILVSEVDTKKFEKWLERKQMKGSINIMEAVLEKINPDYNKKCIQNWRMIQKLRSKKYPVHADDKKFMQALGYFGFSSFPPDWEELWESVLQKHLESLKIIKSVFESKNN